MAIQPFNPGSQGDSKVSVRGIMRDGEMLQPIRTEGGDFQSAAFPVMESLSAVTKRNEENRKIAELEAEVARLYREKKDEERRFKEELELLRREVEKQAFRDGEQKGFDQAMQQHLANEQQLRTELATFMTNMGQAHQDFLNQSDYTLNKLMLAALRKITGHWADTQADAIERTARACLAYLGNEHKAVLFLNSEDREIVEKSLTEWLSVEQGRVEFDIQYSPKVPPRSCHMETSSGSVESSVELMLERVENEIRAALGMENSEH